MLVVPSDAVIGALMGELIRFAGYHPVFLGADEGVAAALERVRPALMFVDSDHPAVKSPDVRTVAGKTCTRIVLFSGARTERELGQMARARGDSAFALPNGPRALGTLIERMLGADCSRSPGGAPRAAPPLRS